MRLKKSMFLLLILCLLPGASLLWAAPLGKEVNKSGPINIEADRMESDQQKNVVNFIGNVEARQGDLTILADRMTVHYTGKKNTTSEKNAAPSQEVDSIVSEGNVRLKRENWTASADRMEYNEKQRKVVLIGNTRVWQNNNTVTGDRIELFLDEGKTVVERGSGGQDRVKAFFYPESSSTATPEKEK